MPPHYHCPTCHQVHWNTEYLDGFDLPQDLICEQDRTSLISDGHNIPWQTLWGYDKHAPTFTLDLPTCLYEDFSRALETHWLKECRSVSNLDFHNDISKSALYFFNLCFAFDLDDDIANSNSFHTEVVNASCVQKALNTWPTLVNYPIRYHEYSHEAIPPPESFADIVSFYGIFHSTGTWDKGAYSMISFLDYSLSNMIAFRDDVYQYLLEKGFLERHAWRGMENVQNGSGLANVTKEMRNSRDKWVLDRYKRAIYLVPKAHAVEYIFFKLKSQHGLSTVWGELKEPPAYIN